MAITIYQTRSPKISKRETQLLTLLLQGRSRKMIADELALRQETVNSYFKKLYRKLDVNSASGAIGAAYQKNLI
jgi:two-component system, NarL family, competent response regulator ComA